MLGSSRIWWSAGGIFGASGLAAAFLITASAPATPESRVSPGITLAGVPLEGSSRADVERVATELRKRWVLHPVRIRCGKQRETTTLARLGAQVDVPAAVEAVFARSAAETGLLQRLYSRFSGPETVVVPLPVGFTREGVARGVADLSGRAGTLPRNARLKRDGGGFRIVPSEPGREIDAGQLAVELAERVSSADLQEEVAKGVRDEIPRGRWLRSRAPLGIEASLREAPARITREHLGEITARLASFETSLGSSSRNRTHNVDLAARSIDGTVLLPGDTFSYNEIVGPRVASAGFREAPQIVRGELQPGTGGGICQVSSTLYNAVLLADLKVVRRQHHAVPVAYVPPGRDATVVDGVIDFRFQNPLPHPVALDVRVVGRKVVTAIYGHPDDRVEVELTSGPVTRVPAGARTLSDSRLPRGQRVVQRRAVDGRRVTISRVVRRQGAEVRREVVTRDYYRPFPAEIRVGTRAPLPQAPPAGGSQPAEAATVPAAEAVE
ncbi:MAG: VanW family protein [Armatimonadota bacterium]